MSWLDVRERGSLLGMRFVVACLRTFGLWPARCVVELVVLYFFLTGRSARRASLAYLRRVAASPAGATALRHAPGWWLSWQHFRSFGQMLLDRACFWCGLHDRFEVTFADHELLLDLQAAGKGAILLSAHVGSVDVMRALATRHGRPVRFVMFQAAAPKINAVLHSIAPELESRVIGIDPANVDSILALKEQVDQGDWIALLGDRAVHASQRRIGRARLLGADALFPLGPLLLASVIGCPVYLVFGLKQGPNRYQIVIERFAERIVVDRRNRERELVVWLQRYAQRLEACCLRAPLQWFNFYDFWADTDAPEESHAPSHGRHGD